MSEIKESDWKDFNPPFLLPAAPRPEKLLKSKKSFPERQGKVSDNFVVMISY